MRKKVLLMGKSGSGKPSMRAVIFSNEPASSTARFGATSEVEQNQVRLLGDMVLNLWDCGGHGAFMENYLFNERSTTFQDVALLIYVFDVTSREKESDLHSYRDCLEALAAFSPDASVFILIHKMDLIRDRKAEILRKKQDELLAASGHVSTTVFGTSIWDESIYNAWSRMVHALISNAHILAKHLAILGEACGAAEVVLFERTTFLVIATASLGNHGEANPTALNTGTHDQISMEPTRYERTSELIKAFKHSCSGLREEFNSLDMVLPGFIAVLDELSRNTYVMVVIHDSFIEPAGVKMNIRLARQKFEELQADLTS